MSRRIRSCALGFLMAWMVMTASPKLLFAVEHLVIAGSPSLAAPLKALADAFEAKRAGVKIKLHFASGLELRQMISAMQNRQGNKHFIGSGPIHIVAPGGEELISRLEMKHYALPQHRTQYAAASLVLAVPESLVEAPESFEAMARDRRLRIAVAHPSLTVLGQRTAEVLRALGGTELWEGRLDIATDAKSVLDHLLNGQADIAIVFGPEAMREESRIRIAAKVPAYLDKPVSYSMTMDRFCPNRTLCHEFLQFSRSPEAGQLLSRLGYELPRGAGADSSSAPFAKQ
ncbi:MAG TPA: substrate-binding domain-containing protein [Nitrospira sp.]|nr:substrate-binding domain-containing protein [Nitrospira sp.]